VRGTLEVSTVDVIVRQRGVIFDVHVDLIDVRAACLPPSARQSMTAGVQVHDNRMHSAKYSD